MIHPREVGASARISLCSNQVCDVPNNSLPLAEP